MIATTKNKTMPEMVGDPVCGMTVLDGNAGQVMAHGGHLHYFCSKECRMTFKKNPEKYATARSSKTKSWFGRFLGCLARANEKNLAGTCRLRVQECTQL